MTDYAMPGAAGALALGYANIFVTAPSPENLRTLFDFVFKGLDAAGYQEHIDYDLVESTNPEWGRAVVRINVFRNHRQVSSCDALSMIDDAETFEGARTKWTESSFGRQVAANGFTG